MKIKELMLELSRYNGEEEVQIMIALDGKAYDNFEIKDGERVDDSWNVNYKCIMILA